MYPVPAFTIVRAVITPAPAVAVTTAPLPPPPDTPTLNVFAYPVPPLVIVLPVIPVVIVFALTGLEIGVACLQAYVFTILVCIYLNDAIHLH